mgnify:CR=1 FL=1
MRVLGIDYGQVRVGLALTDPEGRMAFPRPALTRTTRDALFQAIVELVEADEGGAVNGRDEILGELYVDEAGQGGECERAELAQSVGVGV